MEDSIILVGEFSFEFWDMYKALKKIKEVDFESGNKIVSMFAKKVTNHIVKGYM
jgi:hypothetical protein